MVKQVIDKTTGELLSSVVEIRRPDGSLSVSHMNYEPSMTQQHFKDMCDINNIMKRWLNGGPPPVSDASRATFRDVSQGYDYQDIMFRVAEVKESFDMLPADMRIMFKNDPALLMDFVSDPSNFDQAVKLGLIESDSKPIVGEVSKSGASDPVEQLPLDVTVRTDSHISNT